MTKLREINSLFYSNSTESEIRENNTKLVHYTSSETLVKIIKNKEFWLRDILCMNDFTEVQHGISCLKKAYQYSDDFNFKRIIDEIHPESSNVLETAFDELVARVYSGTYIACFSIHNPNENNLGRLSMWRAYSKGLSGVALVLNNNIFFNETSPLNITTNCVSYQTDEEFVTSLRSKAEIVKNNIDYFKSLSQQQFLNFILAFFYSSILSTKHKGFEEEKELRIHYNPHLNHSALVKTEVVTINNIPQTIQKVELRDYENGLDLSPNKIIDRIIIGPSEFPNTQKRAIIEVMRAAGVEQAEQKVHVSNIPIRL